VAGERRCGATIGRAALAVKMGVEARTSKLVDVRQALACHRRSMRAAQLLGKAELELFVTRPQLIESTSEAYGCRRGVEARRSSRCRGGLAELQAERTGQAYRCPTGRPGPPVARCGPDHTGLRAATSAHGPVRGPF
jgi:hypothetical protein